MIQIQEKHKVIFIDWVDFTRRAVMASHSVGRHWLKLTCVKMILACLKKIHITEADYLVIVCDDKAENWRGPRKNPRFVQRDCQLDELLSAFVSSSPFFVLDISGLSALDIASYGAKYFADREVVIISSDKYYEQLAIYPNVKLLSTCTKKYKIINKPANEILNRVAKGIANKGSTNLNIVEYEEKSKNYDITSLPDRIENKIELELKILEVGKTYSENFPFRSINFEVIYDASNKKLTSYSDSLKKKKSKLTNAHIEPLF